jgi:hypothetical protein
VKLIDVVVESAHRLNGASVEPLVPLPKFHATRTLAPDPVWWKVIRYWV